MIKIGVNGKCLEEEKYVEANLIKRFDGLFIVMTLIFHLSVSNKPLNHS
jgi:hypothetical protein